MRMRHKLIGLAVSVFLSGTILVPTGSARADADEKTVDLSIAYGWYDAIRFPGQVRTHISKNQIYSEIDEHPPSGTKATWYLYEGRFKPLPRNNRYLFIVEREVARPGVTGGLPPGCRYAEVDLTPMRGREPPDSLTVSVVFYAKYDEAAGTVSDECAGLHRAWYAWNQETQDRNIK